MKDKLAGFKKLKTREKVLFIALISTVGFGVYYQAIYKPLSRQIVRYRFQMEKAESRITDLQSNVPKLSVQEKNIQTLTGECKGLLQRITEIEKKLPNKRNTSKLLTELTQQAKNLKLVSIRQKIESNDEYSKIFMELKFNAHYKSTVNFIRAIETISPFLVIEELEISEPKGSPLIGGIPTRIVLSSLLGDISTAEMLKAKKAKEALPIPRDIFASKARPVSEIHKVDLTLEGITYNLDSPTAIINGEVARVGSKIGNFSVKEILPDKVILTNGIQDHHLEIER